VIAGYPIRVPMGRPSRRAGLSAIQALNEGLALVQKGDVQALVTAPVSKESFHLADHGFPGHTEWLASACHAPEVAMLMVAGPLRALLMTRHVPLENVSRHLTAKGIERSARLGHQFIKHHVRAGRPRLVLCGLNPHAGDHGLIGKEEKTIFLPALRALRKSGITVDGPLAADAVFPKMARGRYDLALAAYHDQGMIPLKLYAPERVVNVTLGLPFIRTSPGHGTAYDIAGKGKAHPGSMIEAILLAAQYGRRPRG
jgi:4-hydroxythreonine-4-phosphate dehydrogenase